MSARFRRVIAGLVAVSALSMAFAIARPARARRAVRGIVRALSAEATLPGGPARLAPPFGGWPQGRPDVLLVLVDTLRPDHLGAYGYSRATSPFIDGLARDGVVFENAFSQAPWTLPSVASLMTGLFPSELGIDSASAVASARPTDGATLAGRFRSAGYRTIALSDHPAINATGFGRGFEMFSSLPSRPFGRWGWAETEAATIQEAWRALIPRMDGRPTFAYVHLYYPHAPYEPAPPFDTLFGWGALRTKAPFRGGVVNLYDGEIRRVDTLLSEMVPLFTASSRQGSPPITAIVSDHGEAFWDHGILGHEETLYNELLRVPFILHAPGRIRGGRRVADLTQMVDVGPTLLDLAGTPDPSGAQRGRSRLRLATGDAGNGAGAEWILSESPVRGTQMRAIQTQSLKVIHSTSGPVVFRLSVDRGETEPLRLEDAPEARGLDSILAGIRPRRVPGAGLDSEGRERMRAIGYVLAPPASLSPT